MVKGRAFIGLVLVALAVMSVLVVFIKYALYSIPSLYSGDALAAPTFETFWTSFATLLGKGGEPTWADRILGLISWAIAIALSATITGFVIGSINRSFDRLRRGKSPVVDSGHTLILGWSNRVFPILNELAIANENVRKPLVVIFSDKTRDFMEDEIASRTAGLGKLKVITRNGDPTNPADLKRANISGAKSIIILDENSAGDANIVSTVLAVKAAGATLTTRIIAEVDDAHVAASLERATDGLVIPVRSQDVIARVTAQASRQPGLAAVTLDLLDFAGDEIYFNSVPALAGKTYSDAILAFNAASVIGIVDDAGLAHLNPSQSTLLTAKTQIIAIAEDDDKVVYTGVREEIATKKIIAKKLPIAKAENLLVIGWSSMGRSVVSELAAFLPKGSSVHIVAQSKFVDAAELADLNFGDIKVTHASVSGDIDELIAAASAKKYNEVIILGYRNAISESEADAQTMLTMLQMNQLFAADGNGVEPTRLVAEILDSRKAELARVASADDLVVSDNLAALLIAQVSENPALAPIFDDLFDAEGASINVRPIDFYAPLGHEIEFAELVAIARAHGESAIGYRVLAEAPGDSASGVRLNPVKTTMFKPAAGDSLVVVSDL